MRLSALVPGETAVIRAVTGTTVFCFRLREMGFVPGTKVTLCKRAPFAGAAEYRIRDYRVCLRQKDASCILADK